MIVLDASAVIALGDARDAHHGDARRVLEAWLGEADWVMHPITLAEVLVGPARLGVAEAKQDELARIGVVEWQVREGAALRVARLCAETGLKVPDCCVLDAALCEGAALITFDRALALAAAARGVTVWGSEVRDASG